MGADPEFTRRPDPGDIRWMTLAEIPERDRAYLWAAGLLSVPGYVEQVSRWGDALSYPGDKTNV